MNRLFCLLQPQPIWSSSQHSGASVSLIKKPVTSRWVVSSTEWLSSEGAGSSLTPPPYLQTTAQGFVFCPADTKNHQKRRRQILRDRRDRFTWRGGTLRGSSEGQDLIPLPSYAFFIFIWGRKEGTGNYKPQCHQREITIRHAEMPQMMLTADVCNASTN